MNPVLFFFFNCPSSNSSKWLFLKIFSGKIPWGFIFFSPPTKKKVSHILAGQAEEVQQYVKNGSRAIRGRVFPEYVCIEDVDKIISSVQRAPEEAAGRGEPGKHLTASETRFTPIDRPTASAMNGKKARLVQHNTKAHTILMRTIAYSFYPNHNVDPNPYLETNRMLNNYKKAIIGDI